MQKRGRYILFGAGVTGLAMLRYYGKERMAAVIDNDPQKMGSLYEGIPVISFETYLKEYRDMPILISIYSRRYFDCLEQLRESGVTDYFTSPPVIYGMESPEGFAERNRLGECARIVFYGSNPITERIEAYVKKDGKIRTCYIDNHLCRIAEDKEKIGLEDLKDEDVLVLTTNEAEYPIRGILGGSFTGRIADIYQYQEERKDRYAYLEQYKDRYRGKRCFVIGNGPSLRKEDLMTLERHHEISFASNGIFHIYDQVSWRPTHYMLCDAVAYQIMYEDIKKIEEEDSFIAEFCYTDLGKISRAKRFYLINRLSRNRICDFSDDAVKGLYSGKTVTYAMMQMACYMGVKEIYLLGVDWTGGDGAPRTEFYELSEGEKKTNSNPFNLCMEEKYAYESAKEYAESHGIKIYNATRGGRLEVFERVDFDTLFNR